MEKEFIEHYLTRKGFLPKHNGFDVLVNAIWSVIEHPEYDNRHIFALAAEKGGYRTWQCAYRAARFAIKKSKYGTGMTVGKFILYAATDISVSAGWVRL